MNVVRHHTVTEKSDVCLVCVSKEHLDSGGRYGVIGEYGASVPNGHRHRAY